MTRCASCLADLVSATRFCPYCGAELGLGVEDAAPTMPAVPTPRSSTRDQPRFPPGVVLGGRYRILERLGQGGMGEVYRATDMRLDHPVALKFLPAALARDEQAIARFHDEVRLARQVSHPNVCRVYDIGELEGSPYISMEYVDGEDLGTLLRRIGRLPGDKAVEIARKLCAGLAAAHAKGVLHRDLKPTNIMLDARGQVLIMDFGLAAVAEQISGPDVRSGTPAFMAPEQIEGREVTALSDVYALGAVLYEVFTGQRAFRDGDRSSTPSATSVVRDMDPVVERLIMRCLDPDPNRRPQSALALARALPGGDPLAEALAAGDTPSPAMVAASEDAGALSIRAAIASLAVVIVALVVLIGLGSYTSIVQLTTFPDPPEVLARKARDMAAAFGYERVPVDSVHNFRIDEEYRAWAERNLTPTDYRAQVAAANPSLAFFEYREAQQYLQPRSPDLVVTPDDPPMLFGDMVELRLDPRGRLRFMRGVPLQRDTGPAGKRVDWTQVLEAAGLDPKEWTPTEPQYVPGYAFDERAAWAGRFPESPGLPMRVEAAAWRGRPVYFIVVGPWSRPVRDEPAIRRSMTERASRGVVLVLLATVLAIAAVMASNNFRRGRGDLAGASRLAAFAVVCGFLQWVIEGHHTFSAAALTRVAGGLGIALFDGLALWVMYLALEPHVRRHWPQGLISWTRALAGDWKDPLVAGHLLVAVALGAGFAVLFGAEDAVGWTRGLLRTSSLELRVLDGVDLLVSRQFGGLVNSLRIALSFFFLFFLLRVVLRRNWAVALAFVALLTFPRVAGSSQPWMAVLFGAVQTSASLFVMARFGVLPLVGAFFVGNHLAPIALAADPSAWYANRGFVTGALVLALAAWSYRHALAGRSVVRAGLLDG